MAAGPRGEDGPWSAADLGAAHLGALGQAAPPGLWCAQMEVLFPVMELARFELAQRYERLLAGVPYERNGGVGEPLDVDVGRLAYRLVFRRM